MFKVITASNLFSWRELRYEIKLGISQITGFNYDDNTSEGSGKSSIPNILCWTLYGHIPKDAKVDEAVREDSTGMAFGEVTLDSGYRIKRSRRPNYLQIFTEDGKLQCGRDIKETQGMIIKLIGLDFDAFCQTVYFAQNYSGKFIASSETDKSQILSEVQDLTIFDRGRKKAQDEAKREAAIVEDLIRGRTATRAEIAKLESNAKLISDFITKFKSDKVEKLEKFQHQISDFKQKLKSADIQNTQAKVDQLERGILLEENLLKSLMDEKFQCGGKLASTEKAIQISQRLKKNVEDCLGRIRRAEVRREKSESKLKALAENKKGAGTCPACGQKASKEKLHEHEEQHKAQLIELQTEIEETETELDELKGHLKQAQDQLQGQADDVLASVELKKALSSVEEHISSQEQSIRRQRSSLTKAQKESQEAKTIAEKIRELEREQSEVERLDCDKEYRRLEEIDTKISDAACEEVAANIQITQHERLKSNYLILKDGFKEIKQYIFQSLLEELSIKSTEYASELFEVPVKVKFSNHDEEAGVSKIKTLVTLDGHERSLGLYSGGQYKRIEISVDLALSAIISRRSEKPINIRIFDEPMKDLSLSSMEKVIKLFEGLKGSTIIIEHNDLIKSIVNSTFDIEYRNGTSSASQAMEM